MHDHFRVPGNFHIEARSDYHNLNPANSNLSHVVNWLSFGPMLNAKMTSWVLIVDSNVYNYNILFRRMKNLGTDKFSFESMTPMNDMLFSTSKLHQAYHHYINVRHSDDLLFHWIKLFFKIARWYQQLLMLANLHWLLISPLSAQK